MFTVYALHSHSHDKIYIGYTSNLELRLLSHNQISKKGFTAKFRPWKLIYSEEYEDKKAAMKREKELKSSRGRVFIRKVIEEKARN